MCAYVRVRVCESTGAHVCVSACIRWVSHVSSCQHVVTLSPTDSLTRVYTGLVRLYLGGDYVRRACLQEKLGPAYGVIMGMYTGQYDLDLTIPTHRVALLRIQEACVFECSRRREALGFDTSQMACTQACICKHAVSCNTLKQAHTRARAHIHSRALILSTCSSCPAITFTVSCT